MPWPPGYCCCASFKARHKRTAAIGKQRRRISLCSHYSVIGSCDSQHKKCEPADHGEVDGVERRTRHRNRRYGCDQCLPKMTSAWVLRLPAACGTALNASQVEQYQAYQANDTGFDEDSQVNVVCPAIRRWQKGRPTASENWPWRDIRPVK